MKNSLFDSLFSSESYMFYHQNSSSFENVPFITLYSKKNRSLGWLLDNVGFIPNLV